MINLDRLARDRRARGDLTETERILELPVVDRDPNPSLDRFGGRVRPVQAACLDAFAASVGAGLGPQGSRGLAAIVGVGHGKTLVGMLAPRIAPCTRPLWLTRASLVRQWLYDFAKYRGLGFDVRLEEWESLTYESLSSPDSEAVLDAIRPDLVVLDEAHILGSVKSARFRRFARYLETHLGTRVLALSGTISTRTLQQAAPVLSIALRDFSPLPRDSTVDRWGAVVNVGGEPDTSDLDAVRPVVEKFGPGGAWLGSKEVARAAVGRRIATAPGVVVEPGLSADVSLGIRLWDPGAPEIVHAALALLSGAWETPDGLELVSATDFARHARTLSLGFWYRFVPGTVDPEWDAARRAWDREVRRLVEYARRFDSRALAERAARDRRLDRTALATWDAWVPYSTWDPPPTEAVWLRGAKKYVRELVERFGSGVVWYRSRALEPVLASVVDSVHGQGSPAPSSGKRVATSENVHGEGWNGQAYRRVLYLEPGPGAGRWEQTLGRQHRAGQTRDVEAWVLQATDPQRDAFRRAIAAAKYVEATTTIPQRLLSADIIDGDDPRGEISPCAFYPGA